MKYSNVISKYITRQFLASLLLVIAIVSCVVILVDSLEMMRRSHNKAINLFYIFSIILLRTPMMLQEVMPFIMIIAGMLCYSRLSRNSELIVMRSVGVSAWQFLMPSVVTAFILGVIFITVLTPITSRMFSKSDILEDKLLVKGKIASATALSSGIWLKDFVEDLGNIIIHADNINYDASIMRHVSFYIYNDSFVFTKRIDAETARIEENSWQLEKVTISNHQNKIKNFEFYKIKTTLNLEKLQDSFSKPNNLSFWSLPSFIKNMKEAGFSALRHIQYYYSLYAFPFIIAAMTLLSGCFSLKISSRIQNSFELLIGIVLSFIIYFFSQMIHAVGLSGTIPLLFSVIAPILISITIGSFIILHREDG
ncbi:MAG: LPS export ABC transporter permease LptG [Sphingobacteriia bacterium]|nr:LPS export ABC transporter permease LptG [Sphingobacteriia bacterium]